MIGELESIPPLPIIWPSCILKDFEPRWNLLPQSWPALGGGVFARCQGTRVPAPRSGHSHVVLSAIAVPAGDACP